MTTVLLADDDEDVRDLVVFRLEEAGFDVIAVDDGAAAVDAVAERRPDLAVLDVGMPGLSGLQVCERIRSNPATARMPVLMLTGAVQERDVEAGFGVGANDYLAKPFSPRELVARIQALLARSQV